MKPERPKFDSSLMILIPLIGHEKENLTEEKYLVAIEKFERKCEKGLIETFSRVDVKASVKTDPYSLPFKDEVTVNLYGESYLNGPYEFFRVAREILTHVLNKNLYQIRFYMFINVIKDPSERKLGIPGRVEYKFRYYPKA